MECKCQLTTKQATRTCVWARCKKGGTHSNHGLPPPGTCHIEFFVENLVYLLEHEAHHELSGGWEGQTKGKSDKGTEREMQNYIAMAQIRYGGDNLLANTRSPSQLSLLIINAIHQIHEMHKHKMFLQVYLPLTSPFSFHP